MTQALLNNLITNNHQSFSDKLGAKDFTQSDFQNVLNIYCNLNFINNTGETKASFSPVFFK